MIIFLLISIANSCIYKLGSQHFNLSTLENELYYQINDSQISSDFFSLAYVFNICGNHPKICGNYPAAYEVINVLGQLTDSCEKIGDPKYEQAELIDNGIRLTYTGGSACDSSENPLQVGKPRQVSFNIHCSTKQQDVFVKTAFDPVKITRCSLEYKYFHKYERFQLDSPTGCPMIQKQDKQFYFFLILSCLVIYLVVGTVINITVHKTPEIPHQLYLANSYKKIKQCFKTESKQSDIQFKKMEQNYDSI